jgi:hypothetical protein
MLMMILCGRYLALRLLLLEREPDLAANIADSQVVPRPQHVGAISTTRIRE